MKIVIQRIKRMRPKVPLPKASVPRKMKPQRSKDLSLLTSISAMNVEFNSKRKILALALVRLPKR
jgi:hypothetical protein